MTSPWGPVSAWRENSLKKGGMAEKTSSGMLLQVAIWCRGQQHRGQAEQEHLPDGEEFIESGHSRYVLIDDETYKIAVDAWMWGGTDAPRINVVRHLPRRICQRAVNASNMPRNAGELGHRFVLYAFSPGLVRLRALFPAQYNRREKSASCPSTTWQESRKQKGPDAPRKTFIIISNHYVDHYIAKTLGLNHYNLKYRIATFQKKDDNEKKQKSACRYHRCPEKRNLYPS